MMTVAPLLAALVFASATGALAAPPPTYNRVILSESASAEIETDRLVVVLYAQAEGRDARQPADEVNQAIDWALAITGEQGDIQTQTLGYQTTPVYKDGRIRGWRVRQSLRLEGTDGQVVGDLTGRLQARLAVQSVNYELSDAQRRETVTTLTDSALERFTARAERTVKTLGREGYRLVSLTINDGQTRPPPVMRAMVAEARADAAPLPASFTAGTQRLTVSVNGEIELSED
jgi:predicted secreted protein